MAKKSSKKAASKSTKSANKKIARKAPAKKKPVAARKSAKAKGPRAVSSGSGANIAEIGGKFVALFNAGTPDAKIWDALFAKNWTSIEGFGVAMAFDGRKAVEEKCRQWAQTHEMHGSSCDGPFLGASGFAVVFTVDMTDKATNQRAVMREAAFYTVKNGKIVQEEFLYSAC